MIRRLAVLASPVFTGAVAVLALNDHVLKGMWPGLVTGKLSDFAGVVVIAIALSVLVGRSAGVGLAAAGFVALKAVPGVNVVVAPLLGGVTMTDRTDIVALLALVPTYRWLGRVLRVDDERASLRAGGRGTALVGGTALAAAVLVTSATSCPTDDGVTALAVDGDRVFAGVTAYPELAPYDLGDVVPSWAVSDDGGMTWDYASGDEPGEDALEGGRRVCDDSGCWEVVAGEQVEFCTDDGCETAFRFTDAENNRMLDQETCATKRYDEFNSVAVVPGTAGHVVVAMGTEGVLVRTTDGTWHRQAVVHLSPSPIRVVPTWVERLRFIAPIGLMAASPLVFLIRLRRKDTMVVPGFLVAAAGGVGLIFLGGMLAWSGIRYDVAGLGIVALSLVVFAVSIAVGGLASEQRRPWDP